MKFNDNDEGNLTSTQIVQCVRCHACAAFSGFEVLLWLRCPSLTSKSFSCFGVLLLVSTSCFRVFRFSLPHLGSNASVRVGYDCRLIVFFSEHFEEPRCPSEEASPSDDHTLWPRVILVSALYHS